mgnify:CR=1 FL=1
MTTPLIRFENVHKLYGAHSVLSDLSFSVAPCEKLSLIGPSGSGKTTILRILMTLEKIEKGAVIVNGRALWSPEISAKSARAREAHFHEMRRDIGMVFQQFNLFPHMTVIKNVMLAPMLTQGAEQAAARSLAMELLEMVGMAHKADSLPSELSGGQKQRVAIACALAGRSALLIADEATSALDTIVQAGIVRLLNRLVAEDGLSLLFITHDLPLATMLADRLLVLRDGRIVESGTPRAIVETPRHPYVAGLVASHLSMEGPRLLETYRGRPT